jgi:hypothetical protein
MSNTGGRRFRSQADYQLAYLRGLGFQMRFRCPECGGSSFGSSGTPPNLQRTCHGNDAGDGKHGCKFRWPEKHDHKYFFLHSVST